MRGDERWSIRGVEHLHGMGVESYDQRFSVQSFGQFLDALKKANVSNMDTIKVANCKYRIAKRSRNFVYTIIYFHVDRVALHPQAFIEVRGKFYGLTNKERKNTLTLYVTTIYIRKLGEKWHNPQAERLFEAIEKIHVLQEASRATSGEASIQWTSLILLRMR